MLQHAETLSLAHEASKSLGSPCWGLVGIPCDKGRSSSLWGSSWPALATCQIEDRGEQEAQGRPCRSTACLGACWGAILPLCSSFSPPTSHKLCQGY